MSKQHTNEKWQDTLQRIRGWHMYKGRKVIRPYMHTQGFKLQFKPKPFYAWINEKGIVNHPDPANPKAKVFIATEIPAVVFHRFVRYYAGKEHGGVYETLMQYNDMTVFYLSAEPGDDEIYCIAEWKGVLTVIGKLLRTDPVYKKCVRAFGKIGNFKADPNLYEKDE